MNSNDHPAAYGYRPPSAPGHYQPMPPVQEVTLDVRLVEVERKSFMLSLKENPRGRFLRITEKSGFKHSTIIIPAPGLKDFQKLLAEMVAAEAVATPSTPPASRT